MKKALIIVGVLVVVGALVGTAFAGGLVVGRFTMQRPTLAPPQDQPVERIEVVPTPMEEDAQNESAPRDPPADSSPTPEAEATETPAETLEPGVAPARPQRRATCL